VNADLERAAAAVRRTRPAVPGWDENLREVRRQSGRNPAREGDGGGGGGDDADE
jgi:hypothetical protein